MSTFYCVGGPKPGTQEAFVRRLGKIGGVPKGWAIYPHASDDGKALHVVVVKSRHEILDHIAQFVDVYEYGEIVEAQPAQA